jgi:hypothetical protein
MYFLPGRLALLDLLLLLSATRLWVKSLGLAYLRLY